MPPHIIRMIHFTLPHTHNHTNLPTHARKYSGIHTHMHKHEHLAIRAVMIHLSIIYAINGFIWELNWVVYWVTITLLWAQHNIFYIEFPSKQHGLLTTNINVLCWNYNKIIASNIYKALFAPRVILHLCLSISEIYVSWFVARLLSKHCYNHSYRYPKVRTNNR